MNFRDLTVLPVSENKNMVIACDSSAGIGEKSRDYLKASTRVVGAFCARVVLMELLAAGVIPEVLIHLVGNEFKSTGSESLQGVQEELKRAGLSQVAINGSSEENMPTVMTSVSITGIGFCKPGQPSSCLQTGDGLYLCGTPLVGAEVLAGEEKMTAYTQVKSLRLESGVRDLLPVGSRGALREAGRMAECSGLEVQFFADWSQSSMAAKSGGPATSLLVGIAQEEQESLAKQYPFLQKIGWFV